MPGGVTGSIADAGAEGQQLVVRLWKAPNMANILMRIMRVRIMRMRAMRMRAILMHVMRMRVERMRVMRIRVMRMHVMRMRVVRVREAGAPGRKQGVELGEAVTRRLRHHR